MFLERKTLAIVAGLFCCIACNQVIYFPIDIKMPSEAASVASEANTVLVVDNTALSMPVTNTIHVSRDKKDVISEIDSLGITFNTEFSEFLREKKFGGRVLYTSISQGFSKEPGDSSALPVDTVRKLATEANADVVLSLDQLKAYTKYWSDRVDFFTYADSLQTNIYVGINLFNPEGKRLAPTLRLAHSLMWNVHLKTVDRKKFLDEALLMQGLKATAVQTADMASDKLVPQWETKERWYYLFPGNKMALAKNHANRGEWVKAAKIWGQLYDEEKSEAKLSKLASNIALANEMTDDIENALNWIGIAKEHGEGLSPGDRQRLGSYEKQLKARLTEFKKLDEVHQ
ncbi:MAG: hypothetical protein BGN96_01755 [Bacteroidales bacterium 45-6]|nr:MAG: hypothetical protein BGN96_01755 [Bacteroidales bacterium 45-6]